MSVNKVILIGNCTKDPECRFMPNGEAVTNLSIATNERWKDKNGVKQEKAEYHNLTFYRKLAEIAGEYLKKGSMIYVEGKLQTRKWQDKEGKDRYTTDVVCDQMTMLGGKPEQSDRTEKPARQDAPQAEPATPGGPFDNFDDNIPF